MIVSLATGQHVIVMQGATYKTFRYTGSKTPAMADKKRYQEYSMCLYHELKKCAKVMTSQMTDYVYARHPMDPQAWSDYGYKPPGQLQYLPFTPYAMCRAINTGNEQGCISIQAVHEMPHMPPCMSQCDWCPCFSNPWSLHVLLAMRALLVVLP